MSAKIKRIVPALLDWFTQNARDLPWRRTRDPYAIWVSEIMLQQTQVKTVIPYWERWLRELPTVESLAAAPPAKIHKLWEGLGYYTRVRNMQKAAQQIVEQAQAAENGSTNPHPGPLPSDGRGGIAWTRLEQSRSKAKSEPPHVGSCNFPDTFEEVLALPGVGRYTAGAICSIAFNQPAPILDGNVMRVLTRVFGIAENPKEKKTNAALWQLAGKLVKIAEGGTSNIQHSTPNIEGKKKQTARPTDSCSHLNQSLMELGALICTPRNPQCNICPVKTLCVAFRENRVEELPNLDKRAAATARRFAAFVVNRDGKYLVRQRPVGVVNAHLWEFPNVETAGTAGSLSDACTAMRLEASSVKPLCTVKHSITRYRITLEAYHAKATAGGKNEARPSNGQWLSLAQLDRLAFTSAHRKILAHIS